MKILDQLILHYGLIWNRFKEVNNPWDGIQYVRVRLYSKHISENDLAHNLCWIPHSIYGNRALLCCPRRFQWRLLNNDKEVMLTRVSLHTNMKTCKHVWLVIHSLPCRGRCLPFKVFVFIPCTYVHLPKMPVWWILCLNEWILVFIIYYSKMTGGLLSPASPNSSLSVSDKWLKVERTMSIIFMNSLENQGN